jgi:ceramide glucosyltransferase
MLAVLSLLLILWQFVVAARFPLHRRVTDNTFAPPVTLLKPLKGADADTWHCLESWLKQDYAGPVQILFGVAAANDPVCEIVRQLIAVHPDRDARLVFCAESLGPNSKVSTLVQLHRQTRHDVVLVSDADVVVPPDFLVNVVSPLRDPTVVLVNCFYRLANPSTLAMQWEAIAINADFWSQVLQSESLKPLDFALGAVMATTRRRLDDVGGFDALVEYLADDYQFGRRIASQGGRIVLSPVVVECRESPRTWSDIWRHQLRWARTIRVCQPLPYFFSILNNATLWPLLCAQFSSAGPAIDWGRHADTTFGIGNKSWTTGAIPWTFLLLLFSLGFRILTAGHLQSRMNQSVRHRLYFWLVPIKDLLNAVVWALAFLGNTVEWRGQRYRVRRGGELVRYS